MPFHNIIFTICKLLHGEYLLISDSVKLRFENVCNVLLFDGYLVDKMAGLLKKLKNIIDHGLPIIAMTKATIRPLPKHVL